MSLPPPPPLPSPPDMAEWQAALARLRDQGLDVLPNLATDALVIVAAGTAFSQVPTAQWRPGLSPRQVCNLSLRPADLALYLGRVWRRSWLDGQRRGNAAAPRRSGASDLDDPWSDAPEDS